MARRPEFYFDEKTGYYRKRVKLQSGTYKDVRAKSKEELRAKLYDLETVQRMGVILDDKTTVAQLLAQWYTNRKDGLSYSRRRDYVNAINNHICPIIGGYRLKSVKPEDCQRVMAALASKSNSLQTKVLGVMNMGFDCAVENGLIFRSPCAKIKAGGVPTEEKVPLTPEQCAALEDATKGTRAYLFVLIGLYTGLRREETGRAGKARTETFLCLCAVLVPRDMEARGRKSGKKGGASMNRPLNKEQVKGLFEQEAVLMGTEDQVPYFRVAALFGEDAVEHARRLDANNPGRYSNGYGVGDCTMAALTLRGFQAAASFYNVQLLRKEVS
mgnify:FL=1